MDNYKIQPLGTELAHEFSFNIDDCYLNTGPQTEKCRDVTVPVSLTGRSPGKANPSGSPCFKHVRTIQTEKPKYIYIYIFSNQKVIFNLNWPEHCIQSVILSRQMLGVWTLPVQLRCSAQPGTAAPPLSLLKAAPSWATGPVVMAAPLIFLWIR